jgi:hypothetical protein
VRKKEVLANNTCFSAGSDSRFLGENLYNRR